MLVVILAVCYDLDGSNAFSPSSDGRSDLSKTRRRNRSMESNNNNKESRHSMDLHVSLSAMNIYAPPVVSRKQGHSVKVTKQSDVLNLPSRSRAVGKLNRNSRMVRPVSRNSSPRLDGKIASADREDLLSREDERVLTHSIRSLRRAVRVRDELVGDADFIPSEFDWANACGLSVLGLRRVMHDGQLARTRLVAANTGLVTSVAKRHYLALKQATEAGGGVGTILTLQDLIQEGNLGLMQAAERFEAERGLRFSTYATYWIKQRILRSISDSSRIIRLPAHVHSMLQKVNRARKDVYQMIGREPSTSELAHYMEVKVDELIKLTSRSLNVVSLEKPLRSGGSLREDTRTIGDILVSDAPTPEEDAQRQSLKNDIRAVINELAERERDVLILRFGLDDGEPMTVSQTAKKLGISGDRVRLVEARALNKLRSPQRNYRLKEYIGGQIEEDQTVEEETFMPESLWSF